MSGGCKCKALVEGKKCASCVPGTFGLTYDNPEGCTRCFCFGRTTQCYQANLVWNQLSSAETKRRLTITRGNTRLDVSHGLLVVPGDRGNSAIGVERLFTTPLYWNMPKPFLGDKVTSYNGYLRFSTSSNGDTPNAFSTDPLVQIQSHQGLVIIEHFPNRLSSSGRYEVRLHEDHWVEKGTRLPVTRELLMVALQNINKVLIRATDLNGATEAQLNGVTLDQAVTPIDHDDRAIALGVENCQCPPKYNGTSCQNPGTKYYRWFKEDYKTSTNMIDLVGDSKRCQCNGRASECHPETGHCQGCKENTDGPACDLCAGGFYGNPLSGEKCKACQCPSAENNHAATCSIDIKNQFICQCKQGYTGIKCDRCDYGYYGNTKQDCLSCNCNPHGSLSDQCDQITGQCYCVQGVTGRDCSQCKPRQVLVQGGRCKDCDHPCVEPLLDTMDDIIGYYDNANVSDIDPDPILRLMRFKEENSIQESIMKQVKNDKGFIDNGHAMIMALRPHAELTMLEAKKYKKAAFMQDKDSHDLHQDCALLKVEASSLRLEIEGILRRLKNYGVSEYLNDYSIQLALEEARRILAQIKKRDYGEADIKARTELSYARQVFNSVKEMLFGQNTLQDQRLALEKVESKVNDLLKFLNNAMDQTREGILANQKHHDIFLRTQTNCDDILKFNDDSIDKMKGAELLLRDAREHNSKIRQVFRQMGMMSGRLRDLGSQLKNAGFGLSEEVEDYRIRLVEPCDKHAKKLLTIADNLLGMFGSELGMNAEQKLRAANAYHRIMKTILDASKVADETLILIRKLMEQVASRNVDGYDLFAQADEARVKSRDLRQEAEGLRQNAQEMQIQIEELILRWQSYLLMVNKRVGDLEDNDRNLDRLQIVSVMAETAVRQSNDALREAETVDGKVSKAISDIKNHLWKKVKEMQSFSQDELGNIPRKCKFDT